jgi:metal-sulfur cluster biosynthetic enzyme
MSAIVPPDVARAAVEQALRRVVDPCSIATGVPITIADMGLVHDVSIRGADVQVTLCLTSPVCLQAANIISAVHQYVGQVDGVSSVSCQVNAAVEWMPEMMALSARDSLRKARSIPPRVGPER